MADHLIPSDVFCATAGGGTYSGFSAQTLIYSTTASPNVTTLYTVPAGKIAFIVHAYIATSTGGIASISVGPNLILVSTGSLGSFAQVMSYPYGSSPGAGAGLSSAYLENVTITAGETINGTISGGGAGFPTTGRVRILEVNAP